MKKILAVIAGLLIVPIVWGICLAQERKNVAILPFTVYSAENIEYIRQGTWRILSSRLGGHEGIVVTGRDAGAEAAKSWATREPSPQEVEALGQNLRANFVVWGVLTKIGNSLSMDAKLSEIGSGRAPQTISTQSQSLDEVIPRTGELAERLARQITGAPETAAKPPAPPPAQATPLASPPPGPAGSREAEIIAQMRGGGRRATVTAAINPDFINAPGSPAIDRRGFWMSNEFPFEFKGMATGDLYDDKQPEIVLIDNNNLFIYKMFGRELKQIHHFRGRGSDNFLSVDIMDLNGNGIPEIFVTNIVNNLLNSFVLEWREGKFQEIASGLRLFLRAIQVNGSETVLLGQTRGINEIFNSPIHEMVFTGGQYRQGKRMSIPEGLAVYGLTIDNLGSGGDKIVTFNEFDNLVIFTPTTRHLSRLLVFGGSRELLYRSDDSFGGTNNVLRPETQATAQGEQVNNIFLNLRLLTHDFEGRGRRALVVPKNISSTGRLFANLRIFTGSEIHSLSWDGLGLAENWRTRKINGFVSDYQIVDLNGDGKFELLMVIVKGTGAGFKSNSVLASYELTVN